MSGQNIGDLLGEILENRYKCSRRLGKQAGRQTLLARDLKTQQQVVVKLLSFSSDFNWEDLKLFQREVETLKSLSHPAIPQYLDSFEIDTPSRKGFALVQTYIEAKSLQEYLSDGRTFSENEVKQLATALLDILGYLHQRQPPVIHRDIKPSNILLKNRSGNSVGEVYLVDFGAVQTLATQQGKTVTVVGTYGYMPPEQFGGRAVPASDLYGLGATLIALITKQHPADLPQQDLRIEFEQFTELSPGFSNWLKWMTHPSLERRPASVQIAKEVLEKPQQIDKYSRPVRQGKIVSTDELFWNAIEVGISTGTKAIGACAVIILSIIAMGFWEQIFIGGFWSVLFALPLALANGIIAAIVTCFWFSPLTNPKLHRQVLNAISIVTFTSATSIFLWPMMEDWKDEGTWNIINDGELSMSEISFILAISLIVGLSMGTASKSIARWYQKASGL
ncbi:MAG: serine/threonine protein kinase [Microcoleus sp. PH2017_01_SCD_O_A]|uniref:serine/threonine protein kinase n=1 Tax=unclassified Microcoleus TaxID=2642155 RepID=UPI001DC1F2B3|nr:MULTISPECIES: serine/threonine-protein kinase [unclassified Microcoleus]MCC3419060.1 serine/threonine protein kinase [Microcoleus sp. PH2017_07_MST_O_A]MCC3467224.1 serine/threonine protein kinase [Microcoleus sp. PH2017_06_SFM_O_A]MCC3512799.1 serine/threonine protein kinase [Microcoleus sp. PH2017_17_BER_D_A]TAE06152.1 MAG: serine/threonine protein kinase [Oscillatoriales cyanobacterium]MCC3428012.1 serine/threonine protein kinase [Microcoleus sp. PH2017_01_SCD_O_A]